MLEKRIEYQHEVLVDGQIQVRRDDQIWEDGIFLSHSYHRHVIHPGQDTSQENDRCRAIATAVHTPEVITAFREAERLRQLEN